ncbi:kinase [Bacillus phage vB_BanS-Tsamsa]|uniref:Protein kinase domain-containing protein n=1 Tax=Bacillus phage vB_BanS-Tsamsa TaxID=1308863 RepID=U5JA50_9CAUD|nr:kinase [Bacillus phage vB_BanS-Tsamsa]AGI11789.1 hypothetical protein [Bacillus phage vB_BanS-Tsamsa]
MNTIAINDMEHIRNMVEIGDNAYGQGLKTFDRLGHGFYGTVYGYKDYAIKYFRYGMDSFSKDIEMLVRLQHIKHVPRLYEVIDNKAIVMSRVRGYTINRYMQHVESKRIDNFVSPRFNIEYRKALQDIMRAGIHPADLHNENVMIEESTGLPVIVDLGEFRDESFSELSIENLNYIGHTDTYDEVIVPMEKYINDTYIQEANQYKEMLMERIDLMGGIANIY